MSISQQLIKFLSARPFRPFTVELDNDTAYAIATSEHASVLRTILVIEDDTGAADLVAISHITRLRVAAENL